MWKSLNNMQVKNCSVSCWKLFNGIDNFFITQFIFPVFAIINNGGVPIGFMLPYIFIAPVAVDTGIDDYFLEPALEGIEDIRRLVEFTNVDMPE